MARARRGRCAHPAARCCVRTRTWKPVRGGMQALGVDLGTGKEGCVCIVQHDRHGNTVPRAPLPVVQGSPGLDVCVARQQDGSVRIAYSATAAGAYSLSCMGPGEAYPGSPWTVAVRPSAVLPETCEAQLLGGGQCVAGGDVQVAVCFRDRYGNMVGCGLCMVVNAWWSTHGGRRMVVNAWWSTHGQRTQVDQAAHLPPVEVWAEGPAHVAFDAPSNTTRLVRAGAYWVHVAVGGTAIAGWPRLLHVLAGEADAARCQLCRAPAACRVGEPVGLLLQAYDAFGNVRCVGGGDVGLVARLGGVQVQVCCGMQFLMTTCTNHTGPSQGPWQRDLWPAGDGAQSGHLGADAHAQRAAMHRGDRPRRPRAAGRQGHDHRTEQHLGGLRPVAHADGGAPGGGAVRRWGRARDCGADRALGRGAAGSAPARGARWLCGARGLASGRALHARRVCGRSARAGLAGGGRCRSRRPRAGGVHRAGRAACPGRLIAGGARTRCSAQRVRDWGGLRGGARGHAQRLSGAVDRAPAGGCSAFDSGGARPWSLQRARQRPHAARG